MTFNRDSNFSYLSFAAFDANGRTVRPKYTDTEIDKVSSTNANAWVNGKNLNNGSTNKIVVLSLFLNNASKNKWLGADRTLTITSGGLILGGAGTAIGLPGRDDNGALVLGDATHPGYVWVKSYTGAPAQIWAPVTAPGGLVSTYTGNLVLGGDQTGIADEIVVNGGTLALGSADYGITLADGLPIRVCAGAKLILPSRNAVAKSSLKIDGSGGAFGTVELPVDQRIASVSIRDVFDSEEWTTLPEGEYGSSDSSAEFIRDDLFTGPGVLTVGSAVPSTDVMLLIW